MSDNNDKTVPADADDYKDNNKEREPDHDRRHKLDPLVKEAKSNIGEPPNRDEDEFTDDGLEEPEIEQQARNESEKATDKN